MYPDQFYKLSLTLVFSFLSQMLFAQDAKTNLSQPLPLVHSWWVQFNPFGFGEPEVAVAATVMYKQNKHVAFALDAGVFVARQDYNDIVFYPYSGYRLKPAIKFYLQGDKKGPRGLYFGAQGLIKQTGRNKEEWLSLPNITGQPVFTQLVNYKERKKVYGVSMLFGGELVLGKPKKFMLDFYTGLGFKIKNFTATGLPSGFLINYDNNRGRGFGDNVFDIYQNGSYPTMQLGFKLGYRLK